MKRYAKIGIQLHQALRITRHLAANPDVTFVTDCSLAQTGKRRERKDLFDLAFTVRPFLGINEIRQGPG